MGRYPGAGPAWVTPITVVDDWQFIGGELDGLKYVFLMVKMRHYVVYDGSRTMVNEETNYFWKENQQQQ